MVFPQHNSLKKQDNYRRCLIKYMLVCLFSRRVMKQPTVKGNDSGPESINGAESEGEFSHYFSQIGSLTLRLETNIFQTTLFSPPACTQMRPPPSLAFLIGSNFVPGLRAKTRPPSRPPCSYTIFFDPRFCYLSDDEGKIKGDGQNKDMVIYNLPIFKSKINKLYLISLSS